MAPPSVETSTPPTRPPPLSARGAGDGHRRARDGGVAVPGRGDRRRRRGGVGRCGRRRRDRLAGVAGCTPMSANRFTVACRIAVPGVEPPRSCVPSSPHDHWTVPAANTSALPTRCSVSECVAVPGRVVRSLVGDPLLHVLGRRRHVDLPAGAGPVVEVLVPLVAERVRRQRRGAVRARQPACCARSGGRRRPRGPAWRTSSS